MVADIQVPGLMKVGGGALSQLPDVLQQLNVGSVYIVADPIMASLGVTDDIATMLKAKHIGCDVFSRVMPEPDDLSIKDAVSEVIALKHEAIVAVGGGSAIDSAKAIALLASHGGVIRDYKVPHLVVQSGIPVVAIPTTAGTGSECTRVTVISDTDSQEKLLCMGPGLMPKAAIIDYHLSLTVPFRVAADTGIDALTHAIEAYVSRKANPFSEQQAISAMRLIAPHLIDGCYQPDNHRAKEALMLGACLAGMAFSNASVALVHGMSRPLGVHFHVPHGMSNAMLLPQVTTYSLPSAQEKYAQIAQHMGLVDSNADMPTCHERLLGFLHKLNAELKVPSMSAFGIAASDYQHKISLMAEQAIASGSPANNPRVPDTDTLKALYREAYS